MSKCEEQMQKAVRCMFVCPLVSQPDKLPAITGQSGSSEAVTLFAFSNSKDTLFKVQFTSNRGKGAKEGEGSFCVRWSKLEF